MSADALFEIRNSFYLGDMQRCINEAQTLKCHSAEENLEKQMFMFRAYIAQKKYGVVLDEIKSGASKQLLSVRLIAEYLSGDSTRRNRIVQDLDSRISNADPNEYIHFLAAATIYYYEANHEAALRVLHSIDHLECSAMVLQIYLKLDRLDLARKELKRMQEKDDDATLTQLAQAWVNITNGGEKLQDAYYTFQELSDKYGPTALLLNGQAVTLMGQERFEEADTLVQEAFNKDNNNAETLINLIVLSQHLGKSSEVSSRYFSQLKDMDNNHPFVKDHLTKEIEIDSLIKQYQVA